MNCRTKYKQHLIEVDGYSSKHAEQLIQQFEGMSLAQHLRFDDEETLCIIIQDDVPHMLVSPYVFEGRAHLWMN